MTQHLRAALAAFLAVAGLAVFASPSGALSVKPEGQAPLAGATVRPRIVVFSSLPTVLGPYAGPVLERPEAINEEADQELERLKANPAVILPEQLQQFTLDGAAGAAQALAPTVGTGFEGITQQGFIPAEPTVAAGPLNIFTAGNVTVTVTNKDGSFRVSVVNA